MKRRKFGLAAIACMTLACAPAAFAHDVGPRAVVVHDGYAVVHHRGSAPRWLHTHRPFQRWYVKSRHRHMHRLSWMQLYDLYRFEVHHYRPVRHVHRRGCDHDRDRHYRRHIRR